MKKTISICVAILVMSISFSTLAKEIPDVLVSGFNAYKETGPKPALEAWIKGSAIDGSKEALAQANMLGQIGDFYGKYSGYDLVKKNTVSKKINIYFIAVNYEKGSVFAKFVTYTMANGNEVIQTFNFNTDADQIWPPFITYGDR